MADIPPPPPPPSVPPAYGGAEAQPAEIGPAFSYAWNKFSQYAGPLVLITLVVLVGHVILSGIQFGLNRGDFGIGRLILTVVFVGHRRARRLRPRVRHRPGQPGGGGGP